MKTKSITLPQFVKNFPKDKSFIQETHHINYNKDLSYEQKIKCVGVHYKTTKKLAVTDNCIYYICSYSKIARKGKTFYPVETNKETIYIGKNEINFHNITSSTLFEFLKILEIDWFKDINQVVLFNLFLNKTIFRRLITNRIYNEETLYKSAASCIGIKNISWKTVRKYYKWRFMDRYRTCSLTDLYYFTKNIDKSVDILFSAKDDSIYFDLLNLAIQLNEVVDFNWSTKRINEEHKRQIEATMEKEIDTKETVPIYDVDLIRFPFKLLNTEKDIFIEGKTMHHCLYNCYCRSIQAHNYIAFHLDLPEECTLGISTVDDKPVLNQIYKKYDQSVLPSTKEYAEKFIKDYSNELKSLFEQKAKTNTNKIELTLNNPWFYEPNNIDLPY